MRKVLAGVFGTACLGLALFIDLAILWRMEHTVGVVVGILVAPVTLLVVPFLAIAEENTWLPLLLVLGGTVIPALIWPWKDRQVSAPRKHKFDDTPFDLDKSA